MRRAVGDPEPDGPRDGEADRDEPEQDELDGERSLLRHLDPRFRRDEERPDDDDRGRRQDGEVPPARPGRGLPAPVGRGGQGAELDDEEPNGEVDAVDCLAS